MWLGRLSKLSLGDWFEPLCRRKIEYMFKSVTAKIERREVKMDFPKESKDRSHAYVYYG